MANLPNIIEARSGYAARFTAEAVVGLMERSGCSDTSVLANPETVIDETARDGISALGRRGAKRVAMDYWLKHGQSAAKRQALERLAEVFPLFRLLFSANFYLLLRFGFRRGGWRVFAKENNRQRINSKSMLLA